MKDFDSNDNICLKSDDWIDNIILEHKKQLESIKKGRSLDNVKQIDNNNKIYTLTDDCPTIKQKNNLNNEVLNFNKNKDTLLNVAKISYSTDRLKFKDNSNFSSINVDNNVNFNNSNDKSIVSNINTDKNESVFESTKNIKIKEDCVVDKSNNLKNLNYNYDNKFYLQSNDWNQNNTNYNICKNINADVEKDNLEIDRNDNNFSTKYEFQNNYLHTNNDYNKNNSNISNNCLSKKNNSNSNNELNTHQNQFSFNSNNLNKLNTSFDNKIEKDFSINYKIKNDDINIYNHFNEENKKLKEQILRNKIYEEISNSFKCKDCPELSLKKQNLESELTLLKEEINDLFKYKNLHDKIIKDLEAKDNAINNDKEKIRILSDKELILENKIINLEQNLLKETNLKDNIQHKYEEIENDFINFKKEASESLELLRNKYNKECSNVQYILNKINLLFDKIYDNIIIKENKRDVELVIFNNINSSLDSIESSMRKRVNKLKEIILTLKKKSINNKSDLPKNKKFMSNKNILHKEQKIINKNKFSKINNKYNINNENNDKLNTNNSNVIKQTSNKNNKDLISNKKDQQNYSNNKQTSEKKNRNKLNKKLVTNKSLDIINKNTNISNINNKINSNANNKYNISNKLLLKNEEIKKQLKRKLKTVDVTNYSKSSNSNQTDIENINKITTNRIDLLHTKSKNKNSNYYASNNEILKDNYNNIDNINNKINDLRSFKSENSFVNKQNSSNLLENYKNDFKSTKYSDLLINKECNNNHNYNYYNLNTNNYNNEIMQTKVNNIADNNNINNKVNYYNDDSKNVYYESNLPSKYNNVENVFTNNYNSNKDSLYNISNKNNYLLNYNYNNNNELYNNAKTDKNNLDNTVYHSEDTSVTNYEESTENINKNLTNNQENDEFNKNIIKSKINSNNKNKNISKENRLKPKVNNISNNNYNNDISIIKNKKSKINSSKHLKQKIIKSRS